jgi:hypothetical protein
VRIKVFTPILGFVLLLALCFVTPVWADAAMSASQGVVGTTVTISGLTSGSYSIKWDGVVIKQGTLYGSGTSSVSFTVPDATGGNHTVAIDNAGNPVISSTLPFAVLPSISISANSGAVGDEVTVDGKGFAASENNKIGRAHV